MMTEDLRLSIEVLESRCVPTASAVPDVYSVVHETTLAVNAPGVMANDSHTNGVATLYTNPANGSASLAPDGSFVYLPQQRFVGVDSFQYQLSDGNSTDIATVSISVTNDPPIGLGDQYETVTELPLVVNFGVLENDSDPDQDTLTAILETPPSNGTLTLNDDGSFDYASEPGFSGTDSFTYKAFDGFEESDPVTVTIEVSADMMGPEDPVGGGEEETSSSEDPMSDPESDPMSDPSTSSFESTSEPTESTSEEELIDAVMMEYSSSDSTTGSQTETEIERSRELSGSSELEEPSLSLPTV